MEIKKWRLKGSCPECDQVFTKKCDHMYHVQNVITSSGVSTGAKAISFLHCKEATFNLLISFSLNNDYEDNFFLFLESLDFAVTEKAKTIFLFKNDFKNTHPIYLKVLFYLYEDNNY
ncbi:hypothetical protein BpHYR1_049924 [Brachionus plicatilis]|uniref:Uncharacterized protein n=1 Tax=Brachionus plicatilis TaxID=10195 RepID=A0A3M7S5Q8_BRAPC|nr:hypothetical protein BpHYR1_049924 [Brachionus plicatilis]